ncbi:MAG: hypothetical protein AAFZ58_16790, partial [Pseudomonadota bacterium]
MNSPASGPKAADLAYLRFRAPDLDVMQTFLEDFGLIVSRSETPDGVPVLYSRGTCRDPFVHVVEQGDAAFVGVGFQMSAASDLEQLATMDGASAIETMPTPGGGRNTPNTGPAKMPAIAIRTIAGRLN